MRWVGGPARQVPNAEGVGVRRIQDRMLEEAFIHVEPVGSVLKVR
jgi:hypothetical protein